MDNNTLQDVVLEHVVAFFTASRDFNGVPLRELVQTVGAPRDDVIAAVVTLVRSEKVSVAFGSHSVNAHIKRLPVLALEVQVAKVGEPDADNDACVYPSEGALKQHIDVACYNDRPFTKRLALAEAQLTPVYFDLDVLDKYFRNPIYHFQFNDLGGDISIADEYYNSTSINERDKIHIDFGIAYDGDRRRVVVAYLRYLADLSPEHQRIWDAHVVAAPCTMNSDFARATINGDWPEHYSAYQALLAEQVEINKLCTLIGKGPLFCRTFEEDKRPREFMPMLLPTKKNFDAFALTFDKMLSDNIAHGFFKGEVALKDEQGQRLGTLTLLRDFLNTRYRTRDGKKIGDELVAPLKQVRGLRKAPAHKLESDTHDPTLPTRQDELIGQVLHTLTKLRLVLMSHPKAQGYAPPDWLDGDKIVFY
ncbi:MAG: hypothetical protein ACYC1K_02030 [Minisyncoccota bacterium]